MFLVLEFKQRLSWCYKIYVWMWWRYVKVTGPGYSTSSCLYLYLGWSLAFLFLFLKWILYLVGLWIIAGIPQGPRNHRRPRLNPTIFMMQNGTPEPIFDIMDRIFRKELLHSSPFPYLPSNPLNLETPILPQLHTFHIFDPKEHFVIYNPAF